MRPLAHLDKYQCRAVLHYQIDLAAFAQEIALKQLQSLLLQMRQCGVFAPSSSFLTRRFATRDQGTHEPVLLRIQCPHHTLMVNRGLQNTFKTRRAVTKMNG